MSNGVRTQPDEGCPIHPSQSYDWNGHEWACVSCFLGYPAESTYGKILEQIKKALESHEETIYKGMSYKANEYAEDAAKNIMEMFEQEKSETEIRVRDMLTGKTRKPRIVNH